MKGLEFRADREMMDSLKMDASILSPREEQVFRNYAGEVKGHMLNKYGKYMHPDLLQNANGLEDRVLITERFAFHTMVKEWATKNRRKKKIQLTEKTRAMLFREGGIMAFDDPATNWEVLPDDTRLAFMSDWEIEDVETPSSEQMIYVANSFMTMQSITEEIVHQFQSWDLPNVFRECAAAYYEEEVEKETGIALVDTEEDDLRREYYQAMLNVAGDALHEANFGSRTFPDSLYEELFPPETIKRLFPNIEAIS